MIGRERRCRLSVRGREREKTTKKKGGRKLTYESKTKYEGRK